MTGSTAPTANFHSMAECSREDGEAMMAHVKPHVANDGARILDHLRLLEGDCGDRLSERSMTAWESRYVIDTSCSLDEMSLHFVLGSSLCRPRSSIKSEVLKQRRC